MSFNNNDYNVSYCCYSTGDKVNNSRISVLCHDDVSLYS